MAVMISYFSGGAVLTSTSISGSCTGFIKGRAPGKLTG